MRPRRLEVLAFVDDQRIEPPALGDRRLREARLELRERVARAEVGDVTAVARDPVAELVVVRDLHALRSDSRDVIGERPVEAHVKHALAGRDGAAHRLHRELRLAGARGRDHAQPERFEFEPASPCGEAAREPRDERVRLADERARVRRERKLVREEMMHLRRARKGRLVGGQRIDDARGERVPARRIDDPRGRDARDRGVPDRVIGAIQQFLYAVRARAERGGEPPMQVLERARELDRHVALGLQIDLDEPLRRLAQEARLLLDHEHAPGRAHDHEVGFAEYREVVVGARPVHAVIDGVCVGQRPLQRRERFAFALGRARGGEVLPVVGNDAGHVGS